MTTVATAPATRYERGSGIGYRPALDGLRAVAVVAVMLYHAGVGWAQGGFLGVDVFFVLSGFLITLLLLREWDRTRRINLKAFWMRRARRLLPALFVVLAAVAVYALFVTAQVQQAIRGDAIATMLYISNWWFIVAGTSYFAWFSEPSPLRHTWSLAIEEQFYLVFPVILAVVLGRLSSRRVLGALLLAAAVASALLMAVLYVPLTDPSRLYYGTDTRLQGLFLGAALATLPAMTRPSTAVYGRVFGRHIPLSLPGLMAWAGLLGLVVMFVQAQETSPVMYRGGFLVAAVLSCCVIAGVSRSPSGSLAQALSIRPFVALGVISYGLYLWHWPVFVVLTAERTGLAEPWLLVLRFAVTVVLAALSYKYVEEPVRTKRLQARFTRTQWRRAVVVSTVGLAAVTLVVTSTAVSPGLAPPAMAAGARPEPVPDAQGRLVHAFLLGDSQSYGLRLYFQNQVPGLAVNGSTQLGCGTLLPERHVDGQTRPNLPACAEWESRWTREVAEERPDIVVFMLGLGELYDREVDGTVVRFGTAAYRDWLYREIDRHRALVGGNAPVFALTTVLCMRVRLSSGTVGEIANDPQRLAWLNQTIERYGDEHPEVPIVDLHSTVCQDGFTETRDGVTLRDDGLHLNQEGAALVWQLLGPMVIAAGQRS